MLAVFALRLAAGMIACLMLLPPLTLLSPLGGGEGRVRGGINPRFFRTHFLTALALTGVALVCVRDEADGLLLTLLIAATILAFVGSMVWGLEQAPGGRAFVVLTTLALAAALGRREAATVDATALPWVLLGDATSAMLLGAALTAMLLGHSYLIAPTMSLTPLMRLLALLALATAARLAVDGYALGCWTATHSFVRLKEEDAVVLLPLRWLLGFLAPLILDWMAWQTARIRSTQSATGILYVVVIFCFLGELTSQLLRGSGMTF
jgi:hypothetical protein